MAVDKPYSFWNFLLDFLLVLFTPLWLIWIIIRQFRRSAVR